MKNLQKIILLLLAFCMLLVPLAGCKKPTDAANNKSTDQTENNGDIDDEALPPHKTYDGTSVVIFSWNPFMTEFVLDDENANDDKVSQALWKRNLRVAEHLDVSIEYITMDGHYAEMNSFLNTLESSILVGDAAFDIVQQYNLTASAATMRGLYLDIAKNNEVNLTDAEWWPTEIRENVGHNDKVYFITGDIAPTVLALTVGIAFNKTMIRALNLENPYDLHDNNQWTWEKFFEMCDDVYVDQGTPGVDELDRYGFAEDHVMYDVMYHSIGLRLVDKDSDGKMYISDDFGSDKAASFYTRVLSFIDGEDVMKYATVSHLDSTDAPTFGNGNWLFGTHYMSVNYEDVDYGIMPPPKYNSDQSRYYTLLNNNHSQFSIPYDTPNFEISGAVLEYLARESYYKLTPAMFEETFKFQYADAPEEAEMYNVIRESLTWDFGRVYGGVLGIQAAYRNMCINRYGIGSYIAERKEYATTKLGEVVATLEALKR